MTSYQWIEKKIVKYLTKALKQKQKQPINFEYA